MIYSETKSGQTVLVSPQKDGSAKIAVWPPMQCACGAMHALGVNRDGKTRCTECDGKYQQEKSKCQS